MVIKAMEQEKIFWKCPKCRKIRVFDLLKLRNEFKLRCCICRYYIKRKYTEDDIIMLRQKYLVKWTIDENKQIDSFNLLGNSEEQKLFYKSLGLPENSFEVENHKNFLNKDKIELQKKTSCFRSYTKKNMDIYSLSEKTGYTIDELINILNDHKFVRSNILFNKAQKKLHRFDNKKYVKLYGNMGCGYKLPIFFYNKTLIESNKIMYERNTNRTNKTFSNHRFINTNLDYKLKNIDCWIYIGSDIHSSTNIINKFNQIQKDWKYKRKEYNRLYNLKNKK